MPENPKVFIHGTLIEICTRTQEGLPFVAAPFIRLIWLSVLARAQTFYRFTLCHGLLMSNHPHIIGAVYDPADVPAFLLYLKREMAHAVNHLTGEMGHTVWEEGYDSPIILDASKAMDCIAYCYANPSKADLVDCIEDYPNWSTWEEFKNGKVTEISVPRITRDSIPELALKTMSFAEQEQLARELEAKGKERYTLRIDPNAWIQCLPDQLDIRNEKQINQQILDDIRSREAKSRNIRVGPVLGAHALRLQSMRKPHKPKKRGKKMLCLASCPRRRKSYIEWYREQVKRIKEEAALNIPLVWRAARPPGFFMPGGFLYANINPSFVPLY